MTLWTEREFDTGTWGATQDAFEAAFMAAGGPEQMMLICVDGKTFRTQILYAALPSKEMLALLPGFIPMAEDKLPTAAALLVGHNNAFEQPFEYGAGS